MSEQLVRGNSDLEDAVDGITTNSTRNGVAALNTSTGNAVFPGGNAFFGVTTALNGAGVFGANNSPKGVGVQGNGPDAGISGFSETGDGVRAHSNHGNGTSTFAHDPNGTALLAINDAKTASTATDGSPHGSGVLGVTNVPGAAGVFGANNSGNEDASGKGVGVQGNGPTAGVSGFSPQGPGVMGTGVKDAGVMGLHGDPKLQETTVANDGALAGVFGASDVGGGVVGYSRQTDSFGVIAFGGIRASAMNHPLAGEFNGPVQIEGNLQVSGDILLPGADCAEHFATCGLETIEPGSVLVIDQEGSLRMSDKAYDNKVAGVVSGAGTYRPGILLDRQQAKRGGLPVALVGKVYCKVDAQYGEVEVGDLLTSSPTPGHAMRANDRLKAFGSVLGKALRPLSTGQGLIPILVALQ
jgi:hypothetical protein